MIPFRLTDGDECDPEALRGALRERPAGLGATARFADAAPASEAAKALLRKSSLGEGGSSLCRINCGRVDVLAKLEFAGPTGSFKDRGASIMVAEAIARGARTFAIDSSGNAGAAVAAAAARFGARVRVFMPAANSPRKTAQISAYGAIVERVEEGRQACEAKAKDFAEDRGTVYLSHSEDPYWLHGVKTFTYELFEQMGGVLPDVLVLPVGHGTLLVGAYIGARDLIRAGLANRLPKFVGVRSAACPDLCEPPTDQPYTFAEGVAIGAPAYGAEVNEIIGKTGGALLDVDDGAVDAARRKLAGQGFLVEPTGALAFGAISLDPFNEKFRTEIAAGATIATALCGSGLKTL